MAMGGAPISEENADQLAAWTQRPYVRHSSVTLVIQPPISRCVAALVGPRSLGFPRYGDHSHRPHCVFRVLDALDVGKHDSVHAGVQAAPRPLDRFRPIVAYRRNAQNYRVVVE